MKTTELRDLYDFAVDLAWQAGRISLRYFQTDLEVLGKADGTPVTVADRQTEELLRKAVGEHFPDDGFFGEEFGAHEGSSGRTWIADPIDGTKSFIHGVPLYGLLLALVDDGEPVVGVAHFPALDDTVAAFRGGGCFWNGRRCQVSSVGSLNEALVTGSDLPDAHAADTLQQAQRVAASDRLFQAAKLRRTWGDCYGYALVATGRAEVMIDPVVSPWDVAAIQPILEEAGGRLTAFDGRRDIQAGHAVGSNGLLHDEVLKLLGDSAD